MKIFWSWQSDTHQPTGRYFVREVLRSVAEELNGEDETEEAERPASEDDEFDAAEGRIEIDHDTLGVGGSPRIADKILEKIEAAAVFVADLTPVAKTKGGKLLPNPNVMIELGYAMKVLGNERIVLVMNQAEGASFRHLPFDLRHWRHPVTYKLRSDASEEQMAAAAAELKIALRAVVAPGLLLAQRANRAKKTAVREPKLLVEWASGDNGVIAVARDPDLGGIATLAQIKERTPLLSADPPPQTINAGKPGLIISVPNMNAIENWSRERRKAQNENIKAYYQEYERYLERIETYARFLLRSVDTELVVRNVGTAPATNIDVEIRFPDFIMFHDDEGGFPAPPPVPSPPAPPLYPFADIGSPVRLHGHPALVPWGRTIDPKRRLVSFHIADLNHHRDETIQSFGFSFVSPEAVAAFDADYVITAAEPIEPVRGKIRFDFEREA